ncbi:hypothetical protein E3U25_09620 (plasmid) [Paracoccus versutus]|uniref:FecR family protein n=1 Tax=Paracoccus versutus TaxID=34007 RepID=A0A3D9XMW8_PARVE|nr:FecR family protein [Paracoccus versutus]WGR56204.1 hypothetical protein E3U25_09620 [Paracoccus versutus]
MRATPLLPRPDPQERLRAEAADWVVRIVADPALEHDPAFRRWLGGGKDRARAFADARLAWQIAGEVGGTVMAGTQPIRPAGQRPAGTGRGWFRPLAAGLALGACAMAALWLDLARPDLRLRLLADHVARPGAAQDLALPDGSRTLLDGGSALDYAEDAATRRVTLRSGAAFFDVQRDGRPFSVRLGGNEVRVHGTRFEVRDCGGCMLVTLEEGRVEILDPQGQSLAMLEPGQQARIPAQPGARPLVQRVDVPDALSWREGRFTFYDASLREVAGVLQRHGAGAILFASETLARRPITGSISLADPRGELEALAEAVGFRILPLPGGSLLM